MSKFSTKYKLLFVACCILVIASVGLVFLNRATQNKNDAALKEALETKKITESDFSFIEDEMLRKHLVAQENVLKMRVDTTNGEEEGLIQEVDISDPSNLKSYTRSFGLVDSELIVIGNTQYERRDNNAWKKQSFTDEEVEALMGTSTMALSEEITQKRIENAKKLKFEFIGNEKCGELNCYKYKKSTPTIDELESSLYFWFDDREFLLRKELMETPEVSVTTIISYDDIEIDPPENR